MNRTVQDLVGGFVFIAYYWTGFTDDGATVLAICDSRKTANAVNREHKRTRDAGLEYGHRANWWVRRERIRTANSAPSATQDGGGKDGGR